MEEQQSAGPVEPTPEEEQKLIAQHRRSLAERWEAGSLNAKQLLKALGGGAVAIKLSAYPESARERDEEAIGWLCLQLDQGNNPGTAWPFTRERWSVILTRRIANKYPKQRTGRATWIWRHYHVRQLAQNETPEQSADHVASVWTKYGRRVTTSTVLAAAKLAKNKRAALTWIEQCIDANRNLQLPGAPVITERQAYEALERAVERDIAPAYPNKAKR